MRATNDISMGAGMSGWGPPQRIQQRWPALPVARVKLFRIREPRDLVASLMVLD